MYCLGSGHPRNTLDQKPRKPLTEREALELVEKFKPDVLLFMDVSMPKLSGLDVTGPG